MATVSPVDFIMVVALGTLIGSSIVSDGTPLLHGLVAIAALFGVQKGLSVFRARRRRLQRLVDGPALLVVWEGRILPGALQRANMTGRDVAAEVRRAGLLGLPEVRALVIEVTGELSVLSGEGEIDLLVLKGVEAPEEAALDFEGTAEDSGGEAPGVPGR